MAQHDLETIEQVLPHLTPQEKRALLEHLTRAVQEAPPPTLAQRQAALEDLRRELAALPIHNPADGVSNRDHDRLLYGEA
jgi:hypothetical protein